MKTTFTILLSGLLLCGCSKKPAIALIQSGTDVSLKLGTGSCVLHVAKRDGSSIQGISLVTKEPDGKETTITADTGTISEGSDRNTVTISLGSGKIQSPKMQSVFAKMGPMTLAR
jgi:hypothetical protein